MAKKTEKKEESQQDEARRPRQGEESRPSCPNCSTESQVVFLKSTSSHPMFTYYKCPNGCGHSFKRPRPKAIEALGKPVSPVDHGVSAR